MHDRPNEHSPEQDCCWQWLAFPQRTCTVVILRVKLSCITSVDCIKLWLLTWLVNWVVMILLYPASISKGTEKRATKNVQLVLQHCCKTSWIAMLRVFHPHQTCLATNKVFVNRIESGWWNAQHQYSTRFTAMLQNKFHVFCCPFFRTFYLYLYETTKAAGKTLPNIRLKLFWGDL